MTEKEMVNTIAKKFDDVLKQLRKTRKKRSHDANDTDSIIACDELISTIAKFTNTIKTSPDLTVELLMHKLFELRYNVKFLIRRENIRRKPQKPDYDVELTDGTKLTQTDFGGFEFKGSDGYHYHKNDSGEFCRLDD